MGESAFSQIEPLVEALFVNVVAPMEPPYAFFGHSMGALVAFELARKMRREGLPAPAYLFVSAHRAPQLPNPDPTKHLLPDDELVAHLRDLEGTPPEVLAHPELLDMVLPTLRADLTLLNTYDYVAEPPLTTPILALGGIGDKIVGRPQLAAWREVTAGAFAVQQFPGGHFYLHKVHPMLMQVLRRTLATLG
jgi:medium-chain acyl-[acyl-carrier-protein] hydrolase